MICRAGGTTHEHETVAQTRECWANVNAEGGSAIQEGVLHELMESYYKEHPGTESRGADRDEEGWYEMPDPKQQQKPREPGIFKLGDDWYKVQRSASGHLYAKRAVSHDVIDEDNLLGPHKKAWGWEYARGAISDLREYMRVSAEQATEFGKLWNCCINCMKDLTREESMDRGYGPTCAKNNNWPYDHSRG